MGSFVVYHVCSFFMQAKSKHCVVFILSSADNFVAAKNKLCASVTTVISICQIKLPVILRYEVEGERGSASELSQ